MTVHTAPGQPMTPDERAEQAEALARATMDAAELVAHSTAGLATATERGTDHDELTTEQWREELQRRRQILAGLVGALASQAAPAHPYGDDPRQSVMLAADRLASSRRRQAIAAAQGVYIGRSAEQWADEASDWRGRLDQLVRELAALASPEVTR